MPQPKRVKRIRDITACLAYAKLIRDHAEDGEYNPEINNLLVEKLTTLDARGGKREKGQGPALTPVVQTNEGKTAKKAGARRR